MDREKYGDMRSETQTSSQNHIKHKNKVNTTNPKKVTADRLPTYGEKEKTSQKRVKQ